jgi:hypothetical protein
MPLVMQVGTVNIRGCRTEEVNPGAIRVHLPASYQLVHDTFSIEDVRPWLSHDSHALDPEFPAVQAHPALNPVVQILDRKKYGRAPRSCDDLLDIPAQYLVLRQDGSLEWSPQSALQEKHLIWAFELRFPPDATRPCSSVSAYPVDTYSADWESDDEVDLTLRNRLRARGRYD